MLPALANFAGSVLAEFTPVRDSTPSLALHLAPGVIFGVVGLEAIRSQGVPTLP
jgi:hypothetical protein